MLLYKIYVDNQCATLRREHYNSARDGAVKEYLLSCQIQDSSNENYCIALCLSRIE